MSNRTNQGLASMPAQGRSPPVDGRGQGIDRAADQSHGERRSRQPSSQVNYKPAASQQWDEACWDHEHDEAAGHRARRLLSRSNSRVHRIGDRISALQRWLTGERWVRRLAVVIAVLVVIFAGCFGALWWRL